MEVSDSGPTYRGVSCTVDLGLNQEQWKLLLGIASGCTVYTTIGWSLFVQTGLEVEVCRTIVNLSETMFGLGLEAVESRAKTSPAPWTGTIMEVEMAPWMTIFLYKQDQTSGFPLLCWPQGV